MNLERQREMKEASHEVEGDEDHREEEPQTGGKTLQTDDSFFSGEVYSATAPQSMIIASKQAKDVDFGCCPSHEKQHEVVHSSGSAASLFGIILPFCCNDIERPAFGAKQVVRQSR